MSERTVCRTCPLCEATCGLEITVRGDEVVRIRGDAEDVFSRGYLCPKGTTLGELHADPDRLRRPLVRRGSDWREVDWDEAFAAVEGGLNGVIERHGRGALAAYLGNPNVHNLAGSLYVRPLLASLGTRGVFSASTVDQMPKHVSCGLVFGNPNLIPVPDLDRTDYLLMLGANPLDSNGSLCTAPDFPGRLRALRRRGGKLVVVDPRRSRTARVADEHLPIRPGGDAAWLLALANVLVAEGRVAPGEAAAWIEGIERVGVLVEPFTPEAVVSLTGIAAETTRRIARELADAPSAAVYGRIGTHTVEFGTLAAWAVDVLNALTGNLDRPGGAMFPLAAHSRPRVPGPGRGFQTGRWHSRVRGFPEVRSELPVAALAEEIETPGEGQIRALVTVSGNPVLSTPNGARLEAALAGLEFMVSVDVYRNETARHADVILPPPSALERSHYDLAFYGLAVRNVANWSPPVFEASGPSEAEILARLALVAAGQGAGADAAAVDEMLLGGVLQGAVASPASPLHGRDPAELRGLVEGDSPEDRVVDAMLRTGPYGDQFGAEPEGLSLAALRRQPHGVDLGPLEPQLPGALRTPSGRVELAPEPIAREVARLRGRLGREPGTELLLVGRRHVRSNNSWMHNLPSLVSGKDRCTLQVHPDDAARLGLTDGDAARVASRVGKLEAPVEVTEDVMPGVVSLPHGWGHTRPGSALRVAAAHPGVNSNLLTDESVLDPLSGNATLNAIPITLERAGGDVG